MIRKEEETLKVYEQMKYNKEHYQGNFYENTFYSFLLIIFTNQKLDFWQSATNMQINYFTKQTLTAIESNETQNCFIAFSMIRKEEETSKIQMWAIKKGNILRHNIQKNARKLRKNLIKNMSERIFMKTHYLNFLCYLLRRKISIHAI